MKTLSVILLLLVVLLILLKGIFDSKDKECVNTSSTSVGPVEISSPEEEEILNKEAQEMSANSNEHVIDYEVSEE